MFHEERAGVDDSYSAEQNLSGVSSWCDEATLQFVYSYGARASFLTDPNGP